MIPRKSVLPTASTLPHLQNGDDNSAHFIDSRGSNKLKYTKHLEQHCKYLTNVTYHVNDIPGYKQILLHIMQPMNL